MNKARSLVLKASDPSATLAERHRAFDELVGIFQDMAYSCAYAVLGDFPLAEDAAQEAFIAAWQKLSQLRQPEAFPGWFRRIVLTECNRLRRGKRLRTTTLDGAVNLATAHDPQAAIERDELTRAVLRAVEKLPVNERMTALLFYVEERSQADISALMEVPLTTVAKRLYSARARLRGLMMSRLRSDLVVHRPSRSRSFAERVKAGIYDDYIGQYRFAARPQLVVVIRREGGALVSDAAGQTNELFAAESSASELRTREFDGSGKFVRDAKGRVSHLIYYEFGREMGLAEKIDRREEG